jgi:hypothetical protein
MAGFERAFQGGIPTTLVVRLMGIAALPGPLLSLLLHAAGPANLEKVREFMQGAMELWNHTPRPDLGGSTPAQVVATPPARRKRRRR